MGFSLDDIKKTAEKAVEWSKEHPEEVQKGVDMAKEALNKLKK